MARRKMPPTPASSTEIQGQDHSEKLDSLQLAFELPPSALRTSSAGGGQRTDPESSISPVALTANASYPIQPSETVKSRRRSSATQKDVFSLPPPPTRPRRIIQMKPRPPGQDPAMTSMFGADPNKTAPKGSTAPDSGKKKQPSASSAAGRKMARKTAHSLIERRRRLRMNTEFDILKDLIPACERDMHKLAVLQAAIEYIRYLLDCIARLESRLDTTPTNTPFVPTGRNGDDLEDEDMDERDEDEDIEMAESETTSPAIMPNTNTNANAFDAYTPRSAEPSESPALVAQDAHDRRRQSYSSGPTSHRHYDFSTSSSASPSFGPQSLASCSNVAGPARELPSTPLPSPAALGPAPPLRDKIHEASAALMMLNADRRVTPNRGLSVRDLLSSN
ncbi:hypothetical protein F4778DRAFT_734257 [Xylariomycetidae sp. FL2044]|nr:hypothetical protein F4778DRAFT_734257 [Xylariomycetidae sp. FL2044]